MFFKKYGDIVVSAIFLIIGIAMIVAAKALPKSAVMEIGPDFMPTVIGIVIVVLAAILLIQGIKAFKNAGTIDPSTIEKCDYKRVILSFILILIYVYILNPVGYIISTLLYLPLQMYVLSPDDEKGKKLYIQLVAVDIIFTFVVFFLFRYGFKIMLPAGIFTINL